MFDALEQELATRFGLHQQAQAFLRAVLAYITKVDHGGVAGFMSKFDAAGLGSVARSWMGGASEAQGGEAAVSISSAQVESVLGNNGGLIAQLVGSTGLARESVTAALAHALPLLIAQLTPEGKAPTALPAALLAYLGVAAESGAAHSRVRMPSATAAVTAFTPAVSTPVFTAPQTLATPALSGASAEAPEGVGATLVSWLPWLGATLFGLLVLGWCSKPNPPVPQVAPPPAASLVAEAAAPAASSASAAASAASVASSASGASSAASSAGAATSTGTGAATSATAGGGVGVVADLVDGKPHLKVYFDVSLAVVSPELTTAAQALLQYLKEHPEAHAQLTGFNDPSGNAASNAALARKRAEAVREALQALGVAPVRLALVKAALTDKGGNKAEARRVEVSVQ